MDPAPVATRPLKLFYSYSHRDDRRRKRLETHLAALRAEGVIEEWHDGKIDPGVEWDERIKAQLHEADIVLLLVSADFLASEYINSVELRQALERHEQGTCRVIPILLRDCLWSRSPLRKLQALPRDNKPVAGWRNAEAAYRLIAEGIRDVAVQLGGTRADPGWRDTRPRVADGVCASELMPLGDAQERFKQDLRAAPATAVLQIRHLGLDLARAQTRLFEMFEISDVRATRARLQLLVLTDKPAKLGPQAPVAVREWSSKVGSAVEGVVEFLTDKLDDRYRDREQQLGVEIRKYAEVPTIHGFSLDVGTKRVATYFSFCRWIDDCYDWGQCGYRRIEGEPRDPSSRDLLAIFDGMFHHLWEIGEPAYKGTVGRRIARRRGTQ